MPALEGIGPANWLDWCVLLLAAVGSVGGLRRGWVRAVAAIVGLLGATVVAAHLAPALLAATDRRWGLQLHLTALAQRVMPLPDGAGATPYSPSIGALIGAQIAAVTSPTYARAVSQLLERPPSEGSGALLTVDARLASATAVTLLHTGAFLLVFFALRGALNLVGATLPKPRGRTALARLANTVAGVLVGGVEGLALSAVVLATVAALGAVPALSGLTGALAGSRWAPRLLAIAGHALPWVGR